MAPPYGLTRSRSDADDVLQEAMTRAWAFWDRFEAGTNARAWMHRILFNTFVNGYRRRKREREVLGMVEVQTARGPHWSRGERSLSPRNELAYGVGDEVRAALEELPPGFRTVVRAGRPERPILQRSRGLRRVPRRHRHEPTASRPEIAEAVAA